MKIKKTIEEIKKQFCIGVDYSDNKDMTAMCIYDKQAEMVIKALEKEISKNVSGLRTKVKALDVETKQVLTYDCAKCPSCGKWLSQVNRYCQYCGQRLDWEVCRE